MLEHLDTDRDNVSLDQGKVLKRKGLVVTSSRFALC